MFACSASVIVLVPCLAMPIPDVPAVTSININICPVVEASGSVTVTPSVTKYTIAEPDIVVFDVIVTGAP